MQWVNVKKKLFYRTCILTQQQKQILLFNKNYKQNETLGESFKWVANNEAHKAIVHKKCASIVHFGWAISQESNYADNILQNGP